MRFKKGRRRFVFVFPSLGVTIKLPIVHLRKAIGLFVYFIVHLDLRQVYVNVVFPIDSEDIATFKSLAFGGIVANWREFMFFLRTWNPLLQPTYFSLLGLINVQKASVLILARQDDFRTQLCELTQDEAYDDPHHFFNPDNYCLDGGARLRILDYGSKRVRRVITKYGKKISESFDPNYKWKPKEPAVAAQNTQ